mmetsp:Transcript_22712/g.42768  ORF Transcript_22712/g.42768 Transcript_22712/m.42768 type:complete len:215 (+) Transcript_22712:1724-2368(+)
MVGIAILEAPEDGNGGLQRWLCHRHLLKASLQGCILLNVLPILLQCGRADASKLPPGEHGLQEIRRIHGAICLACTNEQVCFVDEKHDSAFCILHFLQYGLQALLKLPTVLSAADKGSDVKRDDPAVLQGFRNIPDHNALGEALRDSSLPNSGHAHEDGIVLRSPCQNLNHPSDLIVAADHRVQPPGLGISDQVAPILHQSVKVRVASLTVHLV